MANEVRWIRTYVLNEAGGSVGTICVYEATGPDALRLAVQQVSTGVYLFLVSGGPSATNNYTYFFSGSASHAVGQTLYVTEGQGLVQSRGGDVVAIRSGDIVRAAANELHWHGAAPDHFMTHLSLTEGVPEGQGPETDWREHVTDAEYRGEPGR